MQLIQIVPRLPPAIDGVGDYAFLLAKQLRAAHDMHTQFVVCNPDWGKSGIGNRESEIELDGFPVHQLKEQRTAELLRVLSRRGMPAIVLLQYVGYGYEKRGCPVWLVSALRAWKTRTQKPAAKLVTMFHEISASGPVWSSAFWISPLQRWIAQSLARLSSHCFTNLNLHGRALKQFTGRYESDITVLPVFSNVGEPELLPDWNKRQPRMIVFGSASQRRKVYLEHKSDLEKACQAMGLDEMVDIGAAVEIPQLSVRVFPRSILSSTEASREMLTARAGFFAYPANCLGKSGIFAAYAAHGLVPVTFDKNRIKNRDGLVFGKHFVSVNTLQMVEAGRFESGGKCARQWYDAHSLPRQAGVFAEKLAAKD
jgi:hypothetical protein